LLPATACREEGKPMLVEVDALRARVDAMLFETAAI